MLLQVVRISKQGPGVSGPYIFHFFFFKMRQTFSQKLFALKNDDKTDDYVCLNVVSLTRTKPIWKMQVLFSLTTWTVWAKESGTGKNVPRPTHRSYYLYSTICSYHQDLALWNIYLSLKTVSTYKKWDVKKKKKWYLLFKHCCFVNKSSLRRIINLYLGNS